MIVVADILDEVQAILGRADLPYVFSALTRAVQTLANKPASNGVIWDPLLVYVDLPVQNGFYVHLPASIDKPIQVNLNSNPSFARAQFYEFGLSGPGSTDQELGWGWQDRGYSPLQVALPAPPTTLTAQSDDATGADAAQRIRLLLTLDNQEETWVSLPMDGVTTSPECFSVVQVVKPVTKGNVTLFAKNETPLAVYGPLVTFPRFTVIKLTQAGVAVRMLARRRTAAITAVTDVIPLHNEMAIILMCMAIKLWRELHYDDAAKAEAQAQKFLDEEQRSRNTFMQVAAAAQSAPALNFNIHNRDSIVVGDVADEAVRVFGPIGTDNIFDRITDAIDLLVNKGPWDPLLGYADIAVADGGYFTLPRQVETVLALNVNGRPQEFKSRWFEFHVNGPGSRQEGWTDLLGWSGSGGGTHGGASPHWSDYGEVCVAFDPSPYAPLSVVPMDWRDSGASVVVYGTDAQGVDLMDPDGTPGFTYTASEDLSTFASGPVVTRIERVEKDVTLSFLQLGTTDGINLLQVLSTYYPDETVPVYRRIRLPHATGGVNAASALASGTPLLGSVTPVNGQTYLPTALSPAVHTVRIRYRKRWQKISSYADPIPLRSRAALYVALFALRQMETDPMGAQTTLESAVPYLREQWRQMNPLETAEIQMKRSWGGAFQAVT